jgi:hypothetical protein
MSNLSALLCFLGFFWMLWDRRKQTWHDMVANSLVVRTALLCSRDLGHVGGSTCPEDQIAKANPANATPAAESQARRRQLIVATANVLDKGVPRGDHPAPRSWLSPRIGRSLALRRPWSASTRLLA